MKIYFTAATTIDGEFEDQYRMIVDLIKKNSHQLASGEQIINEELLGRDKSLGWEKVFEREKKAIENADLVVAEVTSPSTGVGSELTYALTLGIPVLALFYKDADNKLSPMIAGNPSDNLYVEHYDDDNLELKLKNFFDHVSVLKNKKGKLIVLDGANGSGKATQSAMLISYFKEKNISFKYVDYPRYYSSFHGAVVGRYLKGEFGSLNNVSPYLVSLAYAIDRAGTREEIADSLMKGKIVLANRYTPSSLSFMSAKIKRGKKRKEFTDWLSELEYRIHRMPKEDILLYLNVPAKMGQKLVEKKGNRGYVGRKRDIHEANLDYLLEVEKIYKELIKKNKNWVIVNCVKDAKIKPKEEIHGEILEILKEKKII